MASGKKFGGVKQTRQGKIPAASAVPSKKKFGGVKEVPRGMSNNGVESCPQNCPGEYVAGMWIHSRDCPWAAVLWNAHGKTINDWHCQYDCDPIQLPSGWTHPYDCPFWDRTGMTPFDHPKPHDAELLPPASKGFLDTVRAQKKEADERIRRAKEAIENPQPFSEFPKALENDDDDLPF